MDLLLEPATAILAALEGRGVSAVELLEATLARIDALNPALNAVVAERRDLAREAALRSDARRAGGEALPLDGLPMTIKDAFDVTGMPATTGAPPYRDRIPAEDAAAVARLRAAGAVIVGKSNVSAWCMDFQATNPVYGTSNNPWDLERSPGGSSGGAAAAVATGMSALELGSDLGGSIRWPAHACGIAGLKPTFGLVSRRGHNPPPPGVPAEGDLAVAGPLARSVGDLRLMLDVVMGPPRLDGVRPRLEPPRTRDPRCLRVAVWAEDPLAPVHPAVAGAVREAARRLADAGALVDDNGARPGFAFAEAYEVYALMNHALVALDLPEKVRRRIIDAAPGARPGDLDHRSLQARGAALNPQELPALQARRDRMKAAWDGFFGRFDVVLMPPAPVPAILHDHQPDLHQRRLDISGRTIPYLDFLKWSSLATLCHLPAAVVPVCPDADGLPLGVQVVGAEGADLTVLAVADMLEQLGCRYRPPPMVG